MVLVFGMAREHREIDNVCNGRVVQGPDLQFMSGERVQPEQDVRDVRFCPRGVRPEDTPNHLSNPIYIASADDI